MALKMRIELDTGLEADYWRISKVLIVGMQTFTAYVELYKNEQARRSLKQPVFRDEFTWEAESLPVTKEEIERGINPMKVCYTKLKDSELLRGAEDI